MYRFILFYFVLYICIYVAPWSCEARHLVPLYVHTCSGMTIKLNLNLNLTICFAIIQLFCIIQFWFVAGHTFVNMNLIFETVQRHSKMSKLNLIIISVVIVRLVNCKVH